MAGFVLDFGSGLRLDILVAWLGLGIVLALVLNLRLIWWANVRWAKVLRLLYRRRQCKNHCIHFVPLSTSIVMLSLLT